MEFKKERGRIYLEKLEYSEIHMGDVPHQNFISNQEAHRLYKQLGVLLNVTNTVLKSDGLTPCLCVGVRSFTEGFCDRCGGSITKMLTV